MSSEQTGDTHGTIVRVPPGHSIYIYPTDDDNPAIERGTD